jgi:hypothetical protein
LLEYLLPCEFLSVLDRRAVVGDRGEDHTAEPFAEQQHAVRFEGCGGRQERRAVGHLLIGPGLEPPANAVGGYASRLERRVGTDCLAPERRVANVCGLGVAPIVGEAIRRRRGVLQLLADQATRDDVGAERTLEIADRAVNEERRRCGIALHDVGRDSRRRAGLEQPVDVAGGEAEGQRDRPDERQRSGKSHDYV